MTYIKFVHFSFCTCLFKKWLKNYVPFPYWKHDQNILHPKTLFLCLCVPNRNCNNATGFKNLFINLVTMTFFCL